jgi:hypothetical protein
VKAGTSVEVFADLALSPANRVGTLPAETEVTLTGVLYPGRAQLYRRSNSNAIALVGWVNAANLTTCTQPPPPGGNCFIVIPPLGLAAYEAPGGARQTYRGQGDGPAGNSRVYATSDPPQTYGGRTWRRVRYTSLSGAERIGWVGATSTDGGNNLTPCP